MRWGLTPKEVAPAFSFEKRFFGAKPSRPNLLERQDRGNTHQPRQTQDSASNPSYNDSALAAKKQKFLSAYQLGATIAESARFAGVTPRTPYNWRSGDPQFAQAWGDARQKLVEDLEAESFKRAIQGNDRMLMFL